MSSPLGHSQCAGIGHIWGVCASCSLEEVDRGIARGRPEVRSGGRSPEVTTFVRNRLSGPDRLRTGLPCPTCTTTQTNKKGSARAKFCAAGRLARAKLCAAPSVARGVSHGDGGARGKFVAWCMDALRPPHCGQAPTCLMRPGPSVATTAPTCELWRASSRIHVSCVPRLVLAVCTSSGSFPLEVDRGGCWEAARPLARGSPGIWPQTRRPRLGFGRQLVLYVRNWRRIKMCHSL